MCPPKPFAANEAGVWEDVTVRFAPSTFCIDCKVGTSCTSDRGKSPVGHATCPGEILFCDIQANPSRTGLTKQSCHKNYLEVVDLFAKHVAFIGTKFTTASAIVTCLKTWAHLHRPRSEFTLRDVMELHVDAAPVAFRRTERNSQGGLRNPRDFRCAQTPTSERYSGAPVVDCAPSRLEFYDARARRPPFL